MHGEKTKSHCEKALTYKQPYILETCVWASFFLDIFLHLFFNVYDCIETKLNLFNAINI